MCCACSLTLLWPILNAPSWYLSNQGYRYPYLLAEFRQQFLSGQWYPRWLPGLVGGYGYPTFVYYPAGFWFFTLPLALIIPSLVTAVKASLFFLLVLSGIGVYRLGRCFCCGFNAYILVLWFYLTPVIANLIYVRGDFAELTAMLLCPWAFYHFLIMSDRLQHDKTCLSPALWLAVTLAAIVYSHPMITVWLCLALSLCVLGRALDSHHAGRMLLVSALVAILAIALSAAYWYPTLALHDAVDYGTSLTGFSTQSLSLSAIFDFNGQRAGIVLPLMAFLGFYLGWRSRFMLAVSLCYIGFTLYMLPASLPLRESLSVLRYLQFPERVLTVMATLQLIGIAFLFGAGELRLSPLTIRKIQMTALGFLIIASTDHYRFRGPLDFDSFQYLQSRTFGDMTHGREFRPRRASTQGLQPRWQPQDMPIAHISKDATPVVTLSNRADRDIWLWTAPRSLSHLIVNQFYFPGWRVENKGVPLPMCPMFRVRGPSYCLDVNGRIDIALPKDDGYKLHVWYDGPPGSGRRNLIALLVAVLSFAALRRLCRPSPQAISV